MGNCLCGCREQGDYANAFGPSSSWLKTPETVTDSMPSSVHFSIGGFSNLSDPVQAVKSCNVRAKASQETSVILEKHCRTRKDGPENFKSENRDTTIEESESIVDSGSEESGQPSRTTLVGFKETSTDKDVEVETVRVRESDSMTAHKKEEFKKPTSEVENAENCKTKNLFENNLKSEHMGNVELLEKGCTKMKIETELEEDSADETDIDKGEVVKPDIEDEVIGLSKENHLERESLAMNTSGESELSAESRTCESVAIVIKTVENLDGVVFASAANQECSSDTALRESEGSTSSWEPVSAKTKLKIAQSSHHESVTFGTSVAEDEIHEEIDPSISSANENLHLENVEMEQNSPLQECITFEDPNFVLKDEIQNEVDCEISVNEKLNIEDCVRETTFEKGIQFIAEIKDGKELDQASAATENVERSTSGDESETDTSEDISDEEEDTLKDHCSMLETKLGLTPGSSSKNGLNSEAVVPKLEDGEAKMENVCKRESEV